ncbi:MAG TPA: hypothetical protein VH834_24045, partial [Solirubrobacteraceae bacterium]
MHEISGVGLRQRLEQDGRRVELAAAPAGARVQQLVAGHDQQEQRRIARPFGHVLDEVDEDGLGPLEVVDDRDQGPVPCERFENAANAPEGLFGRDRLALGLEQLGDACRRLIVVGRRLFEQPTTEGFDQRPPRQTVAVGQAAADGDGGGVIDRLHHLAHQARLADAGRAEHGEQLAGAIGDGLMECVEHAAALAPASDHRPARPPGPRGVAGANADQT